MPYIRRLYGYYNTGNTCNHYLPVPYTQRMQHFLGMIVDVNVSDVVAALW